MSVGRIGVPGLPQVPYAGTGFMVAKDVVMTNCHVARVFSGRHRTANGVPERSRVSLDFVEDPDARHPGVASPRVCASTR